MNRRYVLAPLLAGLAAALAGGCSNDPSIPMVPKPNRVILIPTEMSLEQAADSAAAGDTLEVVFVGAPISQTLVFSSEQTPLVFRGVKDLSAISSLAAGPLVRFENPREGTRVEDLAFGGGDPALSVAGGRLRIERCRFFGGTTQVSLTGGVRAEIRGSLFRDAGAAAMSVTGGGALVVNGNTVHAPGGAGVDADGTTVDLRNTIIDQAGTYGVRCSGGATLADSSGCNDVWASILADYQGCTAGTGSFSQDPQFCDPDNGDFSLLSISPCAPVNSGGCGRVGALPVGCDPEPPTGSGALRPGSR